MKNDDDESLFPVVLMNDGGFILLCYFRVWFFLGYRKQLYAHRFKLGVYIANKV